jgi:3-hydroxybutyryl-CoA dehydrogenase
VEIRSVGVVGLGTMGAGIVEVFARTGLDVVAVEVNDDLLAAGRTRLSKALQRAVDRGRLSETDRDAQLDRVSFTTARSDLAGSDLVVEAVPERIEVKAELFAELDRICAAHTVLATNTSSLPVSRIATSTGRADRVIGMHFFNPAPVMKLVEVVHTVLTDAAVVDAVRDLAVACGKTPVVVGDRAGFVANALLFGYLNDAALAAETAQARVEDIDAALVAACGLPMGPLTLLDLIGLDVSLDVLETMYDETRDQRYAPAPLLRRKVMAGQLGRKTGIGYYDYGCKPPVSTVASAPPAAAAPRPHDRVVAVVGAGKSALVEAFGALPVVPIEDARGAGVIIVDGGSRTGTAEIAARVARSAPAEAVIAVVATDEAPVAVIAAASGRPADVVGLHLPLAPRPGVLEVVSTEHSAAEAVATAMAVVHAAGLVAVPCRDRPGHVVERLILPQLGDAVRMVDQRYATVEDVDAAMTLGCGYPDGPFALLRTIGADNLRAALLHLAAATHLPSLAPAPLLDELAAFGVGPESR